MGDPIVRVEPLGADIEVPTGTSLFAAARAQGYGWPTLCGGSAICTRCVITVAPEHRAALTPMAAEEREALDRSRWLGQPRPDERLACQVRVLADCSVTKPGVRAPATKEAP